MRAGRRLQALRRQAQGQGRRRPSPPRGWSWTACRPQEWAQIFDEVWRRYRDFFYVANMHGYDWKAIGERYRAAAASTSAHRSDLNYVLGEMVAELNVGHAYIEGGDFELPERPKVGLPGARFELDAEAGPLPHRAIFAGQNEEEKYRSPLTEVGRRRQRRRLRARDRRRGARRRRRPLPPAAAQDRPGHAHAQRASRRSRARARSTYQPIASEADLLYLDWVNANREQGGEADRRPRRLPPHPRHGRRRHLRVHQVVLPADPQGGAGRRRALQRRRQRLAVDHRAARHASCSAPASAASERAGHLPATPSSTATWSCLLNETSASDGDIFPHMFRAGGARAAHRQALLGRRRRHLRPRPADRRRAASSCRRTAPTTPTASGSSRATASTPTSWWRTTRPR